MPPKFPLESIAPMSIDLESILQTFLATEGFYTAKDLGSKLISCLINLAEMAKQN
jgi:hypothetical protein